MVKIVKSIFSRAQMADENDCKASIDCLKKEFE
jgi:hypothetical protein